MWVAYTVVNAEPRVEAVLKAVRKGWVMAKSAGQV